MAVRQEQTRRAFIFRLRGDFLERGSCQRDRFLGASDKAVQPHGQVPEMFHSHRFGARAFNEPML